MDRPVVSPTMESLRTQGFTIIPGLLRREIAEVNAYLLAQPVHLDAHIPQTARNRGHPHPVPRSFAAGSECICVPTAAAILAPEMFEIALALTEVATAYLGRDPPVMYSANVFWTRPGAAPVREDIQAFHQDFDDTKFLAMFVYLTDVILEKQGVHILEGPDGVRREIKGHAGTVFLADTSRMHCGVKPRIGERGLAWFRWGVSDRPPANVWDKIEPIPAAMLGERYPSAPRLRESIKLLVSPP